MKYEIVSYQKARGRNNLRFLRVGLARKEDEPQPAQGQEQQPVPTVISITDTDENSPLWKKDLGDTVEIG